MADNETVTIRAQETEFRVSRSRLAKESGFFRDIFTFMDNNKTSSAPRNNMPIQIETNAVVFQHILDYLRLGVFPLMYDPYKWGPDGFDHVFYTTLKQEAKALGINKLAAWVEFKLYTNCYSHVVECKNIVMPGEGSTSDKTQVWTWSAESMVLRRASYRSHTLSPKSQPFIVQPGQSLIPNANHADFESYVVACKTAIFNQGWATADG